MALNDSNNLNYLKDDTKNKWITDLQKVGGIASIMFKKFGKTTAQDCNRDLIPHSYYRYYVFGHWHNYLLNIEI